MAPDNQTTDTQEQYIEVQLSNLPPFKELNEKVQQIVKKSTPWELYGKDIMQILMVSTFVPIFLIMLRKDSILYFIAATFYLGFFHAIVTNRGGHLITHGALGPMSESTKRAVGRFILEFCGSYSYHMAHHIHIDLHHPYTNIIGLGDSSSWKVPFVGRKMYLFCVPLLLPVITPLVAIQQLVELRLFKELFKFIPVLLAGLAMHAYVLVTYSRFKILSAFVYIFVYRAVFAIPYIHVNIFQHIGLPMYSPKSKPPRVYQMSSGVLNLPRNVILDVAFGHSLISCHVEHHFFPRLSDNMCLKIRPVVRSHLKSHKLNYHEDTYINRLVDFYNRYDELMVHAPPITHFVGI